MKVFLFTILLGLPALAQVQNAEKRAEEMFFEGHTLYKSKQYTEALLRLNAAFALMAKPVIIYNIALCHQKLGNHREAIKAYKKFLKIDPTSDKREKVEQRIRELARKARLPGLVRITSIPPGARVLVEQEEKGRSPCTISLPGGTRNVTIRKEGFLPWTTTVAVVHGGEHSLEARLEAGTVRTAGQGILLVESSVEGATVTLDGKVVGVTPYRGQREPGPVKIILEAPGHDPWTGEARLEAGKTVTVRGELRSHSRRSWMPSTASWALMGSGLGTILVGGIVGGVASTQMAEATDNWNSTELSALADASSLEDSAHEKALASNILLGVGGAALVTGVLLWFLLPEEPDGAARVTPGTANSGALVSGRF